jgi:hypothetical protein
MIFDLGWRVSMNSDTRAAAIVASLLSYRVLYQVFDGSQLIEAIVIPDLDGVANDTHATVAVPGRCNVSHQFTILADFKGQNGEMVSASTKMEVGTAPGKVSRARTVSGPTGGAGARWTATTMNPLSIRAPPKRATASTTTAT